MVIASLALCVSVGTGSAVAANTIFSADIVDGEVKAADLGASAVTSTKVASAAIQSTDLATDAVTSSKLGASAVTNPDIAVGAVTGSKVASNALTGAQVAESTLGKVPDADRLDGNDSAEFGRVVGMGTHNQFDTVAAGDNFHMAAAFIPPASGRCIVTISVQLVGTPTTDL